MNKYNKKKSDQLGMNVSTAMGRLRKEVLYKMAIELEMDSRTGKK